MNGRSLPQKPPDFPVFSSPLKKSAPPGTENAGEIRGNASGGFQRFKTYSMCVCILAAIAREPAFAQPDLILPTSPTQSCGSWDRDGYRSLQVNVNNRGCNILGDAANEPSIAVDPTDSRKIAIGWRQFDAPEEDLREAGWAYSHDAGQTWVFQGTLDPGVWGSDPVLASDAEGRFYYVTINYDALRVFRSFDGGISWPLQTRAADSLVDKPWMIIDTTEGIGHGNIYIINTWGAYLRSIDGGESFQWARGSQVYGYTPTVGPGGRLLTADGAICG